METPFPGGRKNHGAPSAEWRSLRTEGMPFSFWIPERPLPAALSVASWRAPGRLLSPEVSCSFFVITGGRPMDTPGVGEARKTSRVPIRLQSPVPARAGQPGRWGDAASRSWIISSVFPAFAIPKNSSLPPAPFSSFRLDRAGCTAWNGGQDSSPSSTRPIFSWPGANVGPTDPWAEQSAGQWARRQQQPEAT